MTSVQLMPTVATDGMTYAELARALHLSALDLAEMKDQGAPIQVGEGAEHLSSDEFAEFVSWMAERDVSRWGFLP